MARVLVVVDDLSVLELVVGVLVAVGHKVQAARDGVEAREVLDRERVEVLITDLQMPRMDGLALLAHVRSAARGIAVIVASGSWTSGQRQQALDLGAARVYSKPVDLAQLVRDVDELARRELDAPPPAR